MGDDINTSMTKAYTVPAGGTLSADVWYDMEEGFDFAFLEAVDERRRDVDAGPDQPVEPPRRRAASTRATPASPATSGGYTVR